MPIKAEKIEECRDIVEAKYVGATSRRTDRDTIMFYDAKGREIAVLFEDFDHKVHFSFTKGQK